MKSLYWIIGIFVFAVVLVFIFGSNGVTITPVLELNKINVHDHVRGNASSTVTVIEYADFQCPACRSYHPIMRQMQQEFGSKVAFIYRYYPLPMHVNAEIAAYAAEAAGKQGKFWEMHDLLYEKQDEWATSADYESLFQDYARLVGISVEQFKIDFTSKEVKNIIKGYKNYGNSIGIQSTPTFYINGKKIENPTSAEAFKLLVSQALKP